MNTRYFFLTLLTAVLVHFTASRLLPGFPVAVDVFLVVTILNALSGDSLTGLLGGLICGLLHDALSGEAYGLHGFADTLVGYATARVSQRLATRRVGGLLAILLSAAVLQQTVLILMGVALNPDHNLPEPLWVAVRVVSGSLLGLALYLFTLRTRDRMAEARRNRRSRLRLE